MSPEPQREFWTSLDSTKIVGVLLALVAMLFVAGHEAQKRFGVDPLWIMAGFAGLVVLAFLTWLYWPRRR